MQLVVQAGSQCGQVFPIDKDALTIGRGATNDITFVDPAMSRVHCEIRREGDDYVVEDRHSANGTFVNDEQIELPFLLRPGDTIRLGQTVLLFQDDGGADTAASAEQATEDQAAVTDEAPPGKPWVLIASVVGIAIIILAVAFMMSNRTPVPSVSAAPTQTVAVVIKSTVAPTETAASTATSEPTVAATATIPAPTDTVAAPTATAAAPTATVAATSAAVAATSAAVAATSAPTETAASSATPAAQTRAYPIPVVGVVLPAADSKYGSSSPVPFNWVAVDSLAPDEQYRVQVSPNSQFNPIACEIRTRETYATIPGEGVTCNAQWQFGQHYYYRVHIIPRDKLFADPVGSADTAPVNEFTWGP